MGTSAADTEVLELVEGFALWLEGSGMPRIAGRILGWLLVCEPAHQSADDLATALRASRGSISTSTRMLVAAGLVERVSLPGDRRLHYRALPDWNGLLEAQHRKVVQLRELVDRGREVLARSGAPLDRLTTVGEFAQLWDEELAAVLARQRRGHRGGGS